MKKVPLTWKNRACLGTYPLRVEGTFPVKNSARGARVTVPADGRGLVSQAGAVLLWEAMRVTGLGRGLSQDLARWRAPRAVRDPGKIIADLAAAVALGGDCLADIAVLREQPELAGPVASDPVVSPPGQPAGRGPAGTEGRPVRPRAGTGAGLGASRGRSPGRGRRAGHRGPGRHHRDRPLGETGSSPDLEEDVRSSTP